MKEKKTQKQNKTQDKTKADELVKLQGQIEELQQEKSELFEQLQRVSADYANFQKRSPKQIADSVRYEKEKIIKSILPALDNLEHTLQNANSAENVDVLVKGIEIVYDQMLDILKSHNVEQIKSLGDKFDPSLHQAMMQRAEAKSEEDVILEEFQKGYRLGDRVIRPSKVVVNKLPSEEDELAEDDESQAADKE